MTTITELLQEAQQTIDFSDSARLDAELLLCDVMRFERSSIYAHPDQTIPDEKLKLFQSLIERRREGHPIAHLTGKKEFWSLQLNINTQTLIPRPETECLVEAALTLIPDDTDFSLLDLGTGSGAIAIAIASEKPRCSITATDINPDALEIAKKNAADYQLDNIGFLLSDWYKNIPAQSFDLIISNPPYIKQGDEHLLQGDVRFEPELALIAGADGMQAINIILEGANKYLVHNACLLIEHGYDQKQPVQKAFLTHGFIEIKTLQDLSAQDRITYGNISN